MEQTQAKSGRKWRLWVLLSSILVVLDVVTWIGGTASHRREMAAEARRRYDAAMALNAAGEGTVGTETHSSGPRSGVDWTFPVFPGVLFADSWYGVGPLYGRGGVKVVIYYGTGSFVLMHLRGWIA